MGDIPPGLTVQSLDGEHEMAIKVLDDEWCMDCIWCYDNGCDTPCNSEFVCEGQAQGFAGYKKGQHFDYLSKRAYYLDDKNKPKMRKMRGQP